jgi:hypothetical protein
MVFSIHTSFSRMDSQRARLTTMGRKGRRPTGGAGGGVEAAAAHAGGPGLHGRGRRGSGLYGGESSMGADPHRPMISNMLHSCLGVHGWARRAATQPEPTACAVLVWKGCAGPIGPASRKTSWRRQPASREMTVTATSSPPSLTESLH